MTSSNSDLGTYGFKDSGQRHEFESGALRDSEEGKGRPELLSPYALMRIAVVAEKGAKKYGDRNWEKGIPISRFIQSAERHIQQFKMGCTDEDHAAHAAWNLLAVLHIEQTLRLGILGRELDDMPHYETMGVVQDGTDKVSRWKASLVEGLVAQTERTVQL